MAKRLQSIPLIYNLFVALLSVTLAGVGIAAFYPGPDEPVTNRYPVAPKIVEGTASAEEYDYVAQENQWQTYQEEVRSYNAIVAIISLIAAVIVLVVSLTLAKDLIFAEGLLFGGLMTLIYSIIRGFQSENSILRFTVVAISLIVALIIGQIKLSNK